MSAKLESLDEYKIPRGILIKDLRSPDPRRSAGAANRFGVCPSTQKLLTRRPDGPPDVKLKHAFEVVAHEAGFASWASLRVALHRQAPSIDPNDLLCPRRPGGFLNPWFSTYEEAHACREKNGGFLLPYRSQFFVCTATYIEDALHLSPDDEDWARIGWDWARPRDAAAWKRLSDRLG